MTITLIVRCAFCDFTVADAPDEETALRLGREHRERAHPEAKQSKRPRPVGVDGPRKLAAARQRGLEAIRA